MFDKNNVGQSMFDKFNVGQSIFDETKVGELTLQLKVQITPCVSFS
jgi:hypothetical protein